MKRVLLIATVILAAVSCKMANKSYEEGNKPGQRIAQESAEQIVTYTVPELLKNAEELIDKEIKVKGMVEHVCSHSGRRCFLIDSVADESIKVEAGGEIESFGKELLGNNLEISGVFREYQYKATEIDEWEVKLKEEHGDAENGGKQCAAEMANIESMREWMKEHGKDYYAIYYVDGLSYEVVE